LLRDLSVLGISHPDFHAEIIAELERLRDAIARAGGFRISDGFISPLDLIELGLVSVEEAQELRELETAAAAGTR
jgi:hypothetical protein